MRAGILPHADLPHIIPNFRLARSLLKLGCDVRILGSDVVKIGKGHSEAWSSSVEKFKFGESLALHNSADKTFLSWLERQINFSNWTSLFLMLFGSLLPMRCLEK